MSEDPIYVDGEDVMPGVRDSGQNWLPSLVKSAQETGKGTAVNALLMW